MTLHETRACRKRASATAQRLAAILAVIRSEPDPEPVDEACALADELTVSDVAALFGVTPQHVGRWRRGRSSPPLYPAAWTTYTAKDHRYPVDAIDEAAHRRIPSADPERALERVRAERARIGFGRAVDSSALKLAA